MKLQMIPCAFSVCKIRDISCADFSREHCFLGKTDEEISLVCETEAVPEDVLVRDDGWRALRICGVLDFSLIGILAGISAVLAQAGVGIFAVSTYNTDYILFKEENLPRALAALEAAGYEMA